MRVRRCVVSLVWSMLAIGAASLAPPLRAQFVYVANKGSHNVGAYSIGATGALTLIGAESAGGGGLLSPVSVAVDPTGKFVYSANFLDNNVSAFRTGATGALTLIGPPLAAGSLANSVAVEPTGKFVYVANYASSNVSAYSIGATGALTPIGTPVPAGSGPFSVTVDPAGKFVYVANAVSNNVSAYNIGATGVLTPIGVPVATGLNPLSVVVDPTGIFVYVANFGSNNVSAYSIGATGSLTPIGDPVAAGSMPYSVAVDPTGKFVYVVNRVSNNVSAYSIGATGALTPIGDPVAAGLNPLSVAVDPTGNFVYVANQASNNISAYSIGPTGVLTPIGDSVATGAGPESIAITPFPPPSCQVSQIVPGPPKQLIVAMQDTVSGLASINVEESVNAFVDLPAFARGATSQLLVTATKIDPTQSSEVGFLVTNMAGLTTSCDPVDFTLTLDGFTQQHVFRSVSPAEHYIRITNGTPGVRQMTFLVNGHEFPVPALQDGETRSLDIGSAMVTTKPASLTKEELSVRSVPQRSPGRAVNSVVMYASGQRGASAYILIGDASVLSGSAGQTPQ